MLNNIIQDGVILACLTFAEDQARSSGVVTKYYCKYYHNLEDLLRAGTVEKKNSFNIKQRNNYPLFEEFVCIKMAIFNF